MAPNAHTRHPRSFRTKPRWSSPDRPAVSPLPRPSLSAQGLPAQPTQVLAPAIASHQRASPLTSEGRKLRRRQAMANKR
ncbi:hypothetical protein BD310DRAFT_916453 [Dichomitus squalens]|uniref:Uncharacterized protein n=1 Tax=Dichomitus squalens TaxID=114155 RepID=A0A4Q9Q8T8_9APHY|nr:hypothetical protein BD310DRAFT_916453 [Dichomitus squalens]